ncbi:MAG: hypothetical protein ACLQRM_11340 [Acidimicrobiales bacterium]
MDLLSAVHRSGGGTVFIGLIFVVVLIVAAARILPKAGYSAWFSLLLLIPLVNLVMVLVFAFSDWPVDKELRQYRQGGPGPGSVGYPPPAWPQQPPAGYGPAGSQFPPPSWPPPPGGPVPPPQPGGSAPSWPGSMPPTPPEPAGAPPRWPESSFPGAPGGPVAPPGGSQRPEEPPEGSPPPWPAPPSGGPS